MAKDGRQQTVDSSQQSVISNQQSGKTIIRVSSPPSPYSLFGRPTLHHKGAGQSAEQNPVPDWYRAGSPLLPTPVNHVGFTATGIWQALHPAWCGAYPLLPNKGGFALISVIIILALLGIAAGVATSFAHRLKTSRRQVATEDELKALREAILGNPRQYSAQGRSNFGYLGDMGGLPATLADLYTKGTQPNYALDVTTGQGAGWAGPYITPILREDLPDLLRDPYGNTYDYTTTAYQRASDNEWVSARIRSFGPNKTDDGGTGDDKQVEILRRETRSTVSGYVTYPDGTAVNGATVTLYRPVAGSVGNINTTTNASGLYTFTAGVPNETDVPYGIRTITATTPAAGDLRVATGSALAIDNDLSFNLTNWGRTAVIVTSVTLTYTFTPPRYYEEVLVGGNQIFKYDNPSVPNYNGGNRRGSGNALTVSPSVTVNGGSMSTTTRILLDSDSVLLPNIVLYPRGGTLNIKYLNFCLNLTGSCGSPFDANNKTFTVTTNANSSTFTAKTQED